VIPPSPNSDPAIAKQKAIPSWNGFFRMFLRQIGYTLATLFVASYRNQPTPTCIIRHVQRCMKPAPAAAYIAYHVESKGMAKRAFFESPTLCHTVSTLGSVFALGANFRKIPAFHPLSGSPTGLENQVSVCHICQ
jgi:hypothetical protein